MKNGLKNGFKVVAVAAACLAISAPAYAEGSWTSTLSNVKAGYGSRTWTDKNLDNASNYVNIYNCSSTPSTIGIYKDRQWPTPDQLVGGVGSVCDAYVYYGAETNGDIHFTVKSVGGNGSIYGNVKVNY